MELLIGASLIAAFIAGVAALFAPCCVTVLLPSYFASIFREKHKVFLMTFIFFLGILIVFLPLGLGLGFLGQIFSRYHNLVFGIGAIFLIFLGLFLILGIHFSLPTRINPVFKKHNAFSVFILGIFSGIATTCCAPVLAGALTLAVLPGSIIWGGIYTLAYVLGMVAPLFLISLILDKINFSQKLIFIRKPITYSLGKRMIVITITDLIAGIMFLILGIIILYLALMNKLFIHSDYQLTLNLYLTKLLNSISNFIKIIPDYVWALIFVIILILIIKFAIKQFKKNNQSVGR